ncbi:hypothetical protein BU16DRAFT_554140 [Lophium mytilinum]|uniref:DUF7730 domain-containing protein n=1 Tax=Lophium mytilinum TaxID=390894 RepID=A0A6A6RB96_9PEZI|nr:hypothetical protein BU16DRAFT_554140 [Lophium mytilinum]
MQPRIEYYFTNDANVFAQSTFGLDPEAPALLRPRSPRERRLTMTSHTNTDEFPGAAEQTQSIFFSRLPIEIRLIIYEYVLSGNLIHMQIHDYHRIAIAVPCRIRDRSLSSSRRVTADTDRVPEVMHRCREIPKKVRSPINGEWISNPDYKLLDLLPLLLTCRKIYSEAIDALYQNTFDFCYLPDLLKLPRILLPQRFNSIRSLQFTYCMNIDTNLTGFARLSTAEHFDHWDWPFPLWEVIASMDGLRHLRVVFLVGPDHRPYWFRFQDHYLEPLKEAGIGAAVELVMPFADCAMPDMGSSNFRVIIPEEDGYLKFYTRSYPVQ